MDIARKEFLTALLDKWRMANRILIIGHGGCGDGLASPMGMSAVCSHFSLSHDLYFPGTVPAFAQAPFLM